MYNNPTNHPNKLKKAAPNPFIGSRADYAVAPSTMSGGSTQQVTTDSNGMTGVSKAQQLPFSPASARSFDMATAKQAGMNKAQQDRAAASMAAKQAQMQSPLNQTRNLAQMKSTQRKRLGF